MFDKILSALNNKWCDRFFALYYVVSIGWLIFLALFADNAGSPIGKLTSIMVCVFLLQNIVQFFTDRGRFSVSLARMGELFLAADFGDAIYTHLNVSMDSIYLALPPAATIFVFIVLLIFAKERLRA